MSTKFSGNSFETSIADIQTNLNMVQGEIYNFVQLRKKNAATNARKCLLNIMKIAKIFRASVQREKDAMPIRKRAKNKVK